MWNSNYNKKFIILFYKFKTYKYKLKYRLFNLIYNNFLNKLFNLVKL